MRWIDAAEVREGDLIWLPYGQRELAVWSVTAQNGLILLDGSAADPRNPGHRAEVSGARYLPGSTVGLIKRPEG